jgi:hypothetical protein
VTQLSCLSDLKLSSTKDCKVLVTFNIENAGNLAGATVGQVYVHQHRPSIEKPNVELAGFAKLYLQPGETGTASVNLDVGTELPVRRRWLTVSAQGILVLQCPKAQLGCRGWRLRDQTWNVFPRYRSDQAFLFAGQLDLDRAERTQAAVSVEWAAAWYSQMDLYLFFLLINYSYVSYHVSEP